MRISTGIQNVFADNSNFNIRIALHAGPAFFAIDPLTKDPNIYGSSVNRTARMEPVTLPGSIYASDQFASILKLKTMDNFHYQHVGIIELPKGFGKQEVYKISENIKE
jgi:class 3 adenylate cyclase